MQLCQINPPVSTKYGLSAREDNEITWMDVIENFNVIYISIHSTCCWLTQCSILTYWKAHVVSHQGKVVNQSLDCPKAPKCWESNYRWRETYLLCSSTLIRLVFSLLLCTFVLLKHYFHLHSRCKQSEVVFAIQSTRRVMMTYVLPLLRANPAGPSRFKDQHTSIFYSAVEKLRSTKKPYLYQQMTEKIGKLVIVVSAKLSLKLCTIYSRFTASLF